MGNICLNGVGIPLDAESLVETANVETTCFFSDASFEFRYRHFIDEAHLALYPVVERFLREGIRIQDYQFVGVNDFADCSEVLHEVIKDPFVFDEGADGCHIKTIETA